MPCASATLGRTPRLFLPSRAGWLRGIASRWATRGKAVRIFTGAAMPEGMDTVFMQEDCRVARATVRWLCRPASAQGANRRLRGEDIRVGEVALTRGRTPGARGSRPRRRARRQGPRGAAPLEGGDLLDRRRDRRARRAVARRPRSMTPTAFSCTRCLRRLGVEVTDLGILADDPQEIGTALREAARPTISC